MSDTPATPNILRAAVVQMDVRIGENDANFARILERLEETAENGAKLVIFPECALSGYCFESLDEAGPYADARDEFDHLSAVCYKLGLTGVVGYLEQSSVKATVDVGPGVRQHIRQPDSLYNSAVICSPPNEQGLCGANYRKTHLPTLGIDRFVTPGEEFKVYDAPFGKLGVLICYDIRFSEAARCLSLKGADVIALPTNWPEGAESAPDFLTRARAWENRVYILAANRVGVERGRRFIGRSQIVAPTGEILCEAGAEEETILYADLDLSLARQKRIVIEPGEWELDITGDRRPDLYGELTKTD